MSLYRVEESCTRSLTTSFKVTVAEHPRLDNHLLSAPLAFEFVLEHFFKQRGLSSVQSWARAKHLAGALRRDLLQGPGPPWEVESDAIEMWLTALYPGALSLGPCDLEDDP